MPESVWAPFPHLGLPELYHYQALCLTHPRLALSQSASLCVFHSFMEWVMGIFDALKYALTYSTFCLVCIDGRSSISLTCSFSHSSIQCDCRHWFSCCSVVKRAPQCLCLVWIDERSSVETSLHNACALSGLMRDPVWRHHSTMPVPRLD